MSKETLNERQPMSDEKYKDLRVYNLSLKYDFNKTSSIVLGRKININTANIGAVKVSRIAIGASDTTTADGQAYSISTGIYIMMNRIL